MPQKKKDQLKPWEVEFVEVSLDKELKEAFFKWDVKGELTFDKLSGLVDDGFKLSFSSDTLHNCVAAYLTSPKGEGRSRQRCLAARGPDMFGAMRCLAFKYFMVLDSDLDNVVQRDPEGGKWA